MLKPNFLLTHKLPITIYRRGKGEYVDGVWEEGDTTEVVIQANVQQLKAHELMMLPESERSKEWIKVYSADEIRTQREGMYGFGAVYGDNGNDADEFMWQNKRFKVMKVSNWQMGILDHFRAEAVRIEFTPN